MERGSCQWPADMERRRIAALKEFQLNNPDYVFTPEQLSTLVNGHRSRGEKSGPLSVNHRSSAKITRGKASKNENRWCLATTMELLAEMKAFVRSNKLPCLGNDIVKWKEIAVHLSNPCGLELRKLARSSMVRFDNLRRQSRTSSWSRIQPEVQDSMIEFIQICELHKTSGSTIATRRALSTMSMALKCQRSSPSPPSTPATKKLCRRQTSMDTGEPLSAADDEGTLSADESCGGSDDDAVELRSASGSPHSTSADNVDTPIGMLPPPVAESESGDEEDARRPNYHADSWAAPDRLRRSRVPKADTAPAVMRGNRGRTLTYK